MCNNTLSFMRHASKLLKSDSIGIVINDNYNKVNHYKPEFLIETRVDYTTDKPSYIFESAPIGIYHFIDHWQLFYNTHIKIKYIEVVTCYVPMYQSSTIRSIHIMTSARAYISVVSPVYKIQIPSNLWKDIYQKYYAWNLP